MIQKRNTIQISERDKKLLILLAIFICIWGMYSFAYKPIAKNRDNLQKEVQSLEEKYNLLQQKKSGESKLKSDLKAVKFWVSEMESLLPPELAQENIILKLRSLQDQTGLRLEKISFGEVAEIPNTSGSSPGTGNRGKSTGSAGTVVNTGGISSNISNNVSSNAAQAALDAVAGLFDSDNSKSYKTTTGNEKNPPSDFTGIKMEIKATYSADYTQLKNFLTLITNSPNKITVNELTISAGSNGLTGSMNITFYGFRDESRSLPEWQVDTEKGTSNPFITLDMPQSQNSDNENTAGGLSPSTEQKVSDPADFIMTLKPYSSDLPTVIMGKSRDTETGTYIYADGPDFEDVEMQIFETDGKYYYKYKSRHTSYPADYRENAVEFKPLGSTIVLKVLSCVRTGASDKSGVNLTVQNDTDIPLLIQVEGDDATSPRIKVYSSSPNVTVTK